MGLLISWRPGDPWTQLGIFLLSTGRSLAKKATFGSDPLQHSQKSPDGLTIVAAAAESATGDHDPGQPWRPRALSGDPGESERGGRGCARPPRGRGPPTRPRIL